MVRLYYEADANLDALKNEVIAIIGYGNQGRPQALNMRDSGVNVIIGCRKGGSFNRALKDGFQVYSISEAARRGTVIHMLIPDMVQPYVYKSEIEKHLTEGKTLSFAHGFNIHFKQIVPPLNVDVIMIAPKAPGILVRENFVSGSGTPALIAIHRDYTGRAKEKALAMAKAIGCTRVGVLETTFKDEVESDLIGEQIVLVGGLMELIKKGFEILVEEGYPPELAYFEACNEAKLIMDLVYKSGLSGMLKAVSDTAKFGGLTVGPKIIDDHVKERMKRAAREVKSGRFAEAWIKDYEAGMPTLQALMEKIEKHEIERIGKRIRKMAGIEK